MKINNQIYNLGKALIYCKIASNYLEHIKNSKDVAMKSKQLITQYYNKVNSVFRDLKANLTPESAKLLDAEIESDIMVFEAITEKLLHLDEKERWDIETRIDNIIKNKKLKQ